MLCGQGYTLGSTQTHAREGQVGYQSNVCSRERPGAGTAAQGWAVPVHGGVQSCGDVALRGGQWVQWGGWGWAGGTQSYSCSSAQCAALAEGFVLEPRSYGAEC